MSLALVQDLVIIGLYFAIVAGIGIHFSRRNRSVNEFALGGRSIPWWAVLASILAAEISAGTFFGTPGEGFRTRNFTYAQLMAGYLLARVVVSAVFIPAFYKHNVVSIYEFLEIRFGPHTRRRASIVFLITRSLASGSRLWVPTLLLIVLWDRFNPGEPLSNWQQFWFTGGALVLITLLTAIYTAVGGIKAVIWTDVLQIAVLFGALGFSVWYLLGHIPGGWDGVKQQLNGPHDLILWQWEGEEPADTLYGKIKSVLETDFTVWAAFLGSLFVTLATHGTDQDMVQRMLTAKNHHRSRFSLILSGLADLPLVLCFLLVGMLLWVHYQQPGKSAPFAFFIVNELPAGVRGILFAGIFATAMGSLSTALNALATSFTEDWYKTQIHPGATDAQVLRAAKTSTVAFSLILVLIGAGTAYASIVLHARIIPIVLGIFGYTYGSLLGVFLVGLLTRARGSERGNMIAMGAGFIAVAILSGLHNDLWALLHPVSALGEPHPSLWAPAWLPKVEFPWRIFFGTTVTAAVALLFRTPDSQLAVAEAHLQAMRAREDNIPLGGASA